MTRLVPAEDDLAFLLGLLLQQVRPAIVGAWLAERAVVGRELALRITLAAVERPAPPPFALDHLPLSALGAAEADLLRFLLLYVFAVGIVAAGDEGAETTAAPHERLRALRTGLVDGLELLDLQLALRAAHEPLRDLAFRIIAAGEEGSEATLLEHHRLGVVGADLLGHVVVQLRPPVSFDPRELPRVLAVGIAGAGEELPVATPLEDHRLAALVADLIRLLFHALDVLHLLRGLLEVL